LFDSIIIIVGLTIDLSLRGVDEEFASLVVILRLWRFFKIIEEMSAGAQETMGDLEATIEMLQLENQKYKIELAKFKGDNHV
jgi:hypothetical protein